MSNKKSLRIAAQAFKFGLVYSGLTPEGDYWPLVVVPAVEAPAVLPAVVAPAVEAPAVVLPAVEVASPLVAGAPVPVAPAVEAPSAGAVEVAEESVLIVLLDSVVAGVVVVLSVVEAVLDSQEVRATARNRADTFRRLFIL
jgi:hypothetical protein